MAGMHLIEVIDENYLLNSLSLQEKE